MGGAAHGGAGPALQVQGQVLQVRLALAADEGALQEQVVAPKARAVRPSHFIQHLAQRAARLVLLHQGEQVEELTLRRL